MFLSLNEYRRGAGGASGSSSSGSGAVPQRAVRRAEEQQVAQVPQAPPQPGPTPAMALDVVQVLALAWGDDGEAGEAVRRALLPAVVECVGSRYAAVNNALKRVLRLSVRRLLGSR